MVAPFNAPAADQIPTMDGFVADYISFFTVEIGRQPTYEEYRQIMTGYAPEQIPVLSAIARGFGVFDHWFSDVPSQTLTNRSFWTAATSSGFVVNRPTTNFIRHNLAETIFDRLEQHGRTWKVYVLEPSPISFTGLIHAERLRDRFATNFVPFAEFERDAAEGRLPDFALIEPNLLAGHGDYHPAFGRALLPGTEIAVDPPSSILAGEAFLARIYGDIRAARSEGGSNVFNTSLLIGWDEPGGTYDHVPPGRAAPPDPSAPPGELGFRFDRSGYRVPAVLVSPWIGPKSVFNEEYRHTSLIATLRATWQLGGPLTDRDASARTFHHVFDLEAPRDPDGWPDVDPQPVAEFQLQRVAIGEAIGTLGRHLCEGLLDHARRSGMRLPTSVARTEGELSPRLALDLVGMVGQDLFPSLTAARRQDATPDGRR
jgi:phospholipase C